jgi:hypothetical protein
MSESMESEYSFFCCKAQFFIVNGFSQKKEKILLDALAAGDSLSLFVRMTC